MSHSFPHLTLTTSTTSPFTLLIHFSYLSGGLTFTNKLCESRPIYTLRWSTAEWRLKTNPISRRLLKWCASHFLSWAMMRKEGEIRDKHRQNKNNHNKHANVGQHTWPCTRKTRSKNIRQNRRHNTGKTTGKNDEVNTGEQQTASSQINQKPKATKRITTTTKGPNNKLTTTTKQQNKREHTTK